MCFLYPALGVLCCAVSSSLVDSVCPRSSLSIICIDLTATFWVTSNTCHWRTLCVHSGSQLARERLQLGTLVLFEELNVVVWFISGFWIDTMSKSIPNEWYRKSWVDTMSVRCSDMICTITSRISSLFYFFHFCQCNWPEWEVHNGLCLTGGSTFSACLELLSWSLCTSLFASYVSRAAMHRPVARSLLADHGCTWHTAIFSMILGRISTVSLYGHPLRVKGNEFFWRIKRLITVLLEKLDRCAFLSIHKVHSRDFLL